MSGRLTLFKNAKVHTVAAERPAAEWFTVVGDRIQAMGMGPPPRRPRRVVDLKGRCVVPGFVDSHIHFFQTGLDRLFVDLAGVSSLDEVVARLEAGARGKRSWVFAHSFEEDRLDGLSRLTRRELDAAFPDRPVWVNRVDYHSAVVNSQALRRLEIPLGIQGLLVEDGEPNGILRAKAYTYAKPRVAQQYPLWVKERALKEAVHACVARGITAVHALEGGPLFGDDGVHILLRKMERLPIDVTMFLQERNVYFTKKLGFDHLGGCILIDGSIGSYTAALDDHYCGVGECGTLYESAKSLAPFVASAHKVGAQVAFHAIGPRAIGVVLDAYHKVLMRQPRYDHRHRIEHFELATDAQLARAADLGVVVAMQPAFEYYWGGPDGMYASRLGEGWRQTNRLRSILDAGIRIAGGSDANVTPPDPLLGMHAAVNHPNPDERITPAEALRMMTLDAAYAAFNETRHGSLEPGKEASFAVLDHDPLTIAPERLRKIRVLETWARGARVHRLGEEDPPWDSAGEEAPDSDLPPDP